MKFSTAKDISMTRRRFIGAAGCGAVVLAGGGALGAGAADESSVKIPFADVVPYTRGGAGRRWWKGNTHMHTLRSDGDAFPIEAAARFKKDGYNFICFTDHNVTAAEEPRWPLADSPVAKKKITDEVKSAFARDFPDLTLFETVKDAKGRDVCRSAGFDEIASLLDERGRFLVISGNEVTAAPTAGNELHCNMVNLRESCRAKHDGTVADCLDWMIGARDRLIGVSPNSMFILNHPLWVSYDVPPQLAVDHPSIRFFEVCNSGSMPRFNLPGPEFTHDKWWDAVNAIRASRRQSLIYGVGCDDIHEYGSMRKGTKRPAAYVKVLARDLSASSLMEAFYCGDFYASTGLELARVEFDAGTRTLSVEVDPRHGDDCLISFIGTKRGVDTSVQETVEWDVNGNLNSWLLNTRHFSRRRKVDRYSDDVGRVFKAVKGRKASYTLQSDDLYVRAKVTTSAGVRPENAVPDLPIAWTQPVANYGQTL